MNYGDYIIIKEQDAEVLIELLNEYPQSVKWTIKGVSVTDLRGRLIKQLKDVNERVVTKAEYVEPTTTTS